MALVLTTSKRTRETVVKERRRGCNWTPVSASGTPSLAAELPVDPEQVIQQRINEKKLLVEVNKMLAEYIGKVEFYKTENARLNQDLVELEKKYKEIDEKLKSNYEAQLNKLRTDLKEEKVEKETLRVKVVRLEDENVVLKEKLEKETAENIVLKETIPKLEKMISERDAKIDYYISTMSSMELEIKKLKEDNLLVKRQYSLLRQEGDNEAIATIELQSQLQSKDDELNFLSSAHEEWRRSILPFETASDTKEFNNELASALRDIRAEYEAIVHATESHNSDEWYRKKFDQLISMSKTQSGDVDILKQRLRESREKSDSLTIMLRQLETQAKISEARIVDLTSQLKEEQEAHQMTRDDLTAENEVQKANYLALMLQLSELSDIRLRLTKEVATYKRLMDVCAWPFRLAEFPIPRYANDDAIVRESYEKILITRGFVTGKDINAALVSISEKQKNKQRRNRDPNYIEKMLALLNKAYEANITVDEFLLAVELEKVLYVKELGEKADPDRKGVLPADMVVSILKDAGYNVEGFNVDEGFFKDFESAGAGKGAGKTVSFTKLVGQALKFFGINETYL